MQAIQRHTFHGKLLEKILTFTKAVILCDGAGAPPWQFTDISHALQLTRAAGYIVRVGNGVGFLAVINIHDIVCLALV